MFKHVFVVFDLYCHLAWIFCHTGDGKARGETNTGKYLYHHPIKKDINCQRDIKATRQVINLTQKSILF